MPTLMLIGAAIFFAGALSVLALMFSSGGWQRSRQFTVLGQLFSGQFGIARRIASMVSVALVVIGATLCFAGVALMDVQRAARCEELCLASGYSNGTIGPSVNRTPASRFVACTCTADDQPPLEQRAHAISR